MQRRAGRNALIALALVCSLAAAGPARPDSVRRVTLPPVEVERLLTVVEGGGGGRTAALHELASGLIEFPPERAIASRLLADLVAACEDSPDDQTLHAALRAVASHGLWAARGFPSLAPTARRLAVAAMRAGGRMKDSNAPGAALTTLGAYAQDAVLEMPALLGDHQEAERVLRFAMANRDFAHLAEPVLLRALSGTAVDGQFAALSLLAYLKEPGPAVFTALVTMIRAPSRVNTAYRAAQALIALAPASLAVVPDLVSISRDPGVEPQSKSAAMHALQALSPGSAAVETSTLDLLKQPEPRAKLAALDPLTNAASVPASLAPRLEELMRDPAEDLLVRIRAIAVLGRLSALPATAAEYMAGIVADDRQRKPLRDVARQVLCRSGR